MARPLGSTARRWRLIGVVVALLSLGAMTACAGRVGAQWRSPSGGATESPAPGESVLVLSLAANATNVSPAQPITAELTNGTLDTATLTNSDGKTVKGDFDADRRTWTNSEKLGYNKTYTFTASGTGTDGKHHEDSRTFSTVKPKNYTLPYLRANVGALLDGGTFGVGQPIVLWFDEPIKDKAAAEKSLVVTTDPPVLGSWYWMDSREVHWRPKDYWPAHTKVTVEANVYGVNLGNGLYGQEDRTATFTIGQKKIAIADSKTHRMKIYFDDVLVTSINNKTSIKVGSTNWLVADGLPISMGRGGSTVGDGGQRIYFTTNSGPHVVTSKDEVYHMTSASYGLSKGDFSYATDVNKAVRISGDGEFVHSAPWSVYDQGKRNVSHGCINVGPEGATWFFKNFGAGDIVDVKNTSAKLDLRNGLGDWVLSWEDWLKGSALT